MVICTACIFFIPIQGTGSPRAEWNKLNKVLKQVLMNSTIIFGFQHVPQIIAFTCDPWNWLKVTPMSSTTSVLKDGKISLEIHHSIQEKKILQNIKMR